MKLEQVKNILDAKVIAGEDKLDTVVDMACGCDLMSDVLSFIKSHNTLLLTGLTNPQTIYTADAVDIKAICFVRGKKPDEQVVNLANSRDIILLATNLPMFESCGRLYKNGLQGCSENGPATDSD